VSATSFWGWRCVLSGKNLLTSPNIGATDRQAALGCEMTEDTTGCSLELVDVTAGYRGSEVLHGVNVRVPVSTVVALVGPNGAGKTTLMRVASGFVKPTRGQVVLGGVDVTGLEAHERVRRGLCDIPEGRGIFPSLTVKENLMLQSGRGREGVSVAAEVFPALGQRLGQVAGSLSGGEQQMLAVVRAYLTDPHIVLIDEVSLGLAPIVVDRIYEYVATIVERGASVLIVEQYVNRVLEIADEVLLLNRGSVVLAGSAHDLRDVDLFERYLGIEVEIP
jgi:branched-chain amino acid transport system ATP-binding protein